MNSWIQGSVLLKRIWMRLKNPVMKKWTLRNYRDKSHQTASEIMRGGEALHQDIGEAEAGHHTENGEVHPLAGKGGEADHQSVDVVLTEREGESQGHQTTDIEIVNTTEGDTAQVHLVIDTENLIAIDRGFPNLCMIINLLEHLGKLEI